MNVFPIIKCVGVACSLRCSYCFYRYMDQSVGSHNVMPLMVLEKLTEQLLEANRGVCNFLWHGGEPLLAGRKFFESALEFQEKYKPENADITNSIQTSGIHIDRVWARFFKAHNFRVGVSLDGPELVHDHYRKNRNGGGSFQKVMRGVHRCREEGVEVGTITVVTSFSSRFPEEIYRFLIESGFKNLAFNPAFEMDGSGNLCDFSVTDQDFSSFLKRILALWLEKDDPTVKIRQFIDPLRGMLGGGTPACIYSGQCEQFLDFLPNGDVSPCHSRNGTAEVLGNILSEPLIEIINNARYHRFAAFVKKIPVECARCKWFPICHGGCTDHRNIPLRGALREGYIYCDSRKAVFGVLEEALRANGEISEAGED